MVDIAKILHFYFKMLKNLPLFERLFSKFTKSANMTPKICLPTKYNKNAENCADFKIAY